MTQTIPTIFSESESVGVPIICYRTAETFLEDRTWTSWPDFPLRLYAADSLLVSISWSRVDDFWLSEDETIPDWTEDSTIRWVENGSSAINECTGHPIQSVLLGRASMTTENREIELWTRLMLDLGDFWLEVFNALDENGYQLHHKKPSGTFVNCV